VSVVANVAINVDSRNAVTKLRQVQQGAQATSQAVDKLNATAAATSEKFKVAANGVKYFTDAAGRARAENGRFLTVAERAAAGIEAQGNAAQRATGKFKGLSNVLASLGAGLALRKAFGDASELESAQARIGLLTKNFQQLSGIQGVAANAAQKFNLSQSESLNALTDLGNRIGPTGASLQDITNVYEGFNTLLALNKVNTQNAASATLQLNQALGSGRLAGEEFNAISEATPQLLDAVAKVMGVTRGELKKLASDGKISSAILIQALTRIRTEGAADLETAFSGAFGATKRFDAAIQDFSATVGSELLPALTPAINLATQILKLFGQLPGPVKAVAAAILGLTAAFVALAPAISATIGLLSGLSLATLVAAGPWIALAAGVTAAAVALAGYRTESQKLGGAAAGGGAADLAAARNAMVQKQQSISLLEQQRKTAKGPARAGIDRTLTRERKAFADLKAGVTRGQQSENPVATAMGTPIGATVGGGGGGSRAGSGADKAAQEAARALEVQKQQLKAADDQNFALKNRFAILQETEAVAKRELELDVRLNEIAREYGELKENAKSNDELILINASSILEKKAAELEAEREINDLIAERVRLMAQLAQEALQPTVYNELETQDAALQSILDKYPAIGAAADSAATMATSGIQAMIAGTKTAEQVFVEFLSSIADALIDTAKQMIAQYIAIGIARMFAGIGGGGGGGFAPSGPLAAVGDVGTGFNFDVGAMIPGRAKGGPVSSGQTYMVGERGPELFVPGSNGGVMSNNDLRSAMNSQGGGGAGSPVLNMSFESTTIGGVEYVSREQLEQAMAETRRAASRDGAQRGMTMTLDRIQNSSSTRRRIGV
jgi:tape measure domain-containing protein